RDKQMKAIKAYAGVEPDSRTHLTEIQAQQVNAGLERLADAPPSEAEEEASESPGRECSTCSAALVDARSGMRGRVSRSKVWTLRHTPNARERSRWAQLWRYW